MKTMSNAIMALSEQSAKQIRMNGGHHPQGKQAEPV
jgi:hypothetical protein